MNPRLVALTGPLKGQVINAILKKEPNAPLTVVVNWTVEVKK